MADSALTTDPVVPPDLSARQTIALRTARLRGICVLAVILIHVTGSFYERRPFDLVAAVLAWLNSASRFAVPVFVILSGFHLSLNTRNERPARFYRRTVVRLCAAYLLYSALYTLVRVSLERHHLLSVREFLSAFAHNVVHVSAAAHLWFIPAILGLYLLHPFLRTAYRRARIGMRFVAGAVCVQTGALIVDQVFVARSSPGSSFASVGVWLGCLSYVGTLFSGTTWLTMPPRS